MSQRHIGIVGGSITGCTAAIYALRQGMHPEVLEKSNGALEDRGAGLGIPSAVAVALRDEGLIYDGFPHVSVRALVHASRSEKDSRMGGCAGELPTFLEGIRWGHLFDHLRSLVPEVHYRAGVEVERAENVGGQVRVEFKDGGHKFYDAVIFADGYQSIGRKTVCPEALPEYQGYFIWRGTLAEQHLESAAPFDTKLQRIGFPGGHFFAYLLPHRDGSTTPGDRELNWGMFVPLPPKHLKEYLLDRYGHQRELALPPGAMRDELAVELKQNAKRLLPEFFAEIVHRSEHTFGQGIVMCIPNQYHSGRICLAGDAGAIVPPFTTSGVFKGMKNAAELIAAFASQRDLDETLNEWSLQQRRTAEGLGHLTQLMTQKLIRNVPNFSVFSQDELTHWWADVQATLEDVMG